MSPIKKYLQTYAETEIELANFLDFQWQQVICIPAYNESSSLTALIKSLSYQASLLVVVVINSPVSASPANKAQTKQTADSLKQQYKLQQEFPTSAALLNLNESGSHLLLIERYALPDDEGVGLARKIACDLACKLIDDNKISTAWIHNTDADVVLPKDYFLTSSDLDKNMAAAIFPFQHLINSDPRIQEAMQLYEFSLDYYLAGLQWAGSSFAFQTIGSTLVLNYKHYALARGFPKRSAGEDFYLLNKLAKTGKIHSLNEPRIKLSSRNSSRVPFGTGPALTKISKLKNPGNDYLYYHPECFSQLKVWLTAIPRLWKTKQLESIIGDESLRESLYELGLEKALSHALSHSKDQETFKRHMNNWFDAFHTLKLIHSLRDKDFCSISLNKLLSLGTEFTFIQDALNARNLSDSIASFTQD